MADSWHEWLTGTPDQQAADWQANTAEYEKAKSSNTYQLLRRLGDTGLYDPQAGTSIDPREARMRMVADTFYPRRTSDAWNAEKAAADYAFAMGQRVRDTALRAAQELAQGEVGSAAGLAARTPLAALYPPASAGTPGADDDWRPVARKNGVPEASILAMDVLTDPETWITAPVSGPAAFVVPALPIAAGRAMASKTDDLVRAVDRVRRGPGVATHLVDQSGDVIRQLKNSPLVRGTPAPQLRIEYAK